MDTPLITGSAFWFKAENADEAAPSIAAQVDHLWEQAREDRYKDWCYHVLYSAMEMYANAGYSSANRYIQSTTGIDSINLNVTRNMVNAVTNKVSKNRPAVKVTPVDANWELKNMADDLSRFSNTRLQQRFRKMQPDVFRDGAVYGTGCVFWQTRFGEETPERIPKREILVDKAESRYGTPHQLHLVKRYHKAVAVQLWPDHEAYIMAAPPAPKDEYWDDEFGESDDNIIRVTESWYVNPNPAEPGKHAISIANKVLVWEDYNRRRFPFQFIHWCRPEQGFWGTGLVAELVKIQNCIDYLVQIVYESLRLGIKLTVLVPRGGRIDTNHFNNEIGNIIEYNDGRPPTFATPPSVSDQIKQFLEYFYDKAYEITGISRLSAQGTKPEGIESAVALQEMLDIETERFTAVNLDYQEMWPEAATHVIELRACIETEDRSDAEEGEDKEGPVSWVDRTVIDRIPWKKVDLARDQFSIVLEATNFLPDTRAGKLEYAKQLAAMQVIPAKKIAGLFATPDMAAFNRLNQASENNVDRILQDLAQEDTDVLPTVEAFHDLGLLFDKVQAQFNDFQAHKAPEELLNKHRDYLVLVQLEMDRGKGPAPGTPAPQGAEGQELPPDGSEMLPPPDGAPMDPGAMAPPPGALAPPVAGALPPPA